MNYCHECLAENRDTATHCVDCGAKLHVVGKAFSEEFHEKALVANPELYGAISAVIASGLYGLACAVLVPGIFTRKIVFFVGLVAVFAFARFCGRKLAIAMNDSSIS